MRLEKFLAKLFEEEMGKVIEKEKLEKGFLDHEDFASCRERAAEGVRIASEKVIDTLALGIAVHREKEHGDNTIEEQASLLAKGAEAEVMGSTWWNH